MKNTHCAHCARCATCGHSARRAGRINLKALVILLVVAVVLMGGAYAGWKIRKRIIADRALEQGKAALAAENWVKACNQLKQYVYRYPEDVEVLKLYAEANLKVRPRQQRYIWQAIAAYRRLIRELPQKTENYQKLVTLWSAVGDHDEVAQVAQRWLRIAPNDIRATIWLARGLTSQRQFDDARDALKGIIPEPQAEGVDEAEVVDAFLMLSDIEQAVHVSGALRPGARESGQKAIAWLDECVKRFPNSAKARAWRARSLRVVMGDRQAARTELETASSLVVLDPSIHIVLYAEWLDHGEFEHAKAELNSAREADARTLEEHHIEDLDSWQLVLFQAEAQLAVRARGVADGAQVAERALAELASLQRRQFLPNAIELFAMGRRADEAQSLLDEYRQVIKARGSEVEEEQWLLLRMLEGRVAVSKDQPYVAVSALEPYLQRRPADHQAWHTLSWAFERTGQLRRFTRALEQYVQARRGALPDSPDLPAVLRLAERYIREGKWEHAERYARELESIPEYATAAAVVLFKANRIRSMNQATPGSVTGDSSPLQPIRDDLLILRGADPDRVDIRLMIASTYLQEKRLDDAVAELELATQECSEPLDAYIQLARFLAADDRLEEAIEAMSPALERFPDVSAPWIVVSELQERADRIDEARQTLRQAHVLESMGVRGRRQVVAAMANLEFRRDQRQAGIALLEQLVAEDSPDHPTDVATRAHLLSLPEIRQDEPAAQKLVDDIRRIEGESGVTWRVEQSRLWLVDQQRRVASDPGVGRAPQEHRQQIDELLAYCIQADPGAEAPALLLAALYGGLDDMDRVEAIYRRVVDNNTRADQAADRLLTLLKSQNRLDEARELYTSLAAKGNVRHGPGLAIALGVGAYDEAIGELQRRVAADPGKVDLAVVLAGLLYRVRGDLDGALAVLAEAEAAAVASDPRVGPPPNDRLENLSHKVISARVALLVLAKRFEEAEEAIEREISSKGTFDAYKLRANYRAGRGLSDLALQDYLRLTTFDEWHSRAAEGYRSLGQFHLQHGRPREAIAAYEKGLETNPEAPGLRRALMGALMGSKDDAYRARGKTRLEELGRENPDDPVLLMARGAVLVESGGSAGDLRLAEGLFERAVRRNPHLVPAHRALIRLAVAQGDYAGPKTLVERAVKDNPGDSGLQLTQAEIERRLGNKTYARYLALEVLKREPDNLQAAYLAAKIVFLDYQDFEGSDGAISLIDRAARLAPTVAEVHQLRAEIYARAQRVTEAIEGLEAFVTANPDQADARMLATLAQFYRAIEEYEATDRWMARAEAMDPDAGVVVRVRMLLLAGESENEDRWDELVSLLSERQASHPDDADTFFLGANLLLTIDEEQFRRRAYSLFKLVGDLMPDSIKGPLGAARAAYLLKDRQGALEAFRQVMELNPDHPETLNGIAWILFEEGEENLPEALGYADRVIVLQPNQPNFRDTRANILLAQGKFLEAKSDFKRCAELSMGVPALHAKALTGLARVLIELEDYGEAKQHLEEALDVDRRENVLDADQRAELDNLMKQLER